MAIQVNYGPISAALGLAQVAGKGQGFNIQAQRDLQALGIQNQMQGQINANNSNLIQMAMARDQAAQQNQLRQEAAHQQQVQQQAELELSRQRLQQQGEQNSAAQQTREEQAKSLVEQRTQAQKEKTQKEGWLTTLTPEQRNAVLSGAGLPIARPATEISPNTQNTDERLRAKAQADWDVEQWKAAQNKTLKLQSATLPDEHAIAVSVAEEAKLKAIAESSVKAFAAPTNVSTNPVNQPAASQPAVHSQGLAPTGPSPFGVGGRKQMPDGSVWTWNGVSWTKG